MRGKNRVRERGHTVIELLLVVILVGIMAAVAAPRFVYPKAGAGASRLASDIQYAKELAIRTQTPTGVFFIDASSYRVFENDNTNDAAVDPHTGGNFEVTMSDAFSGVTLSPGFGDNTIKFNALGTPLDASDTALGAPRSITVSSGGETRTVTIQPNTGKVGVS